MCPQTSISQTKPVCLLRKCGTIYSVSSNLKGFAVTTGPAAWHQLLSEIFPGSIRVCALSQEQAGLLCLLWSCALHFSWYQDKEPWWSGQSTPPHTNLKKKRKSALPDSRLGVRTLVLPKFPIRKIALGRRRGGLSDPPLQSAPGLCACSVTKWTEV